MIDIIVPLEQMKWNIENTLMIKTKHLEIN